MNERLPRVTPQPLPPEREAIFRLLLNLSDALKAEGTKQKGYA
jgi:hypothetical protein